MIDNGVMTRTVWSGADEIGVYDTNGSLVRRFIPDGTGAMDARLATVEATGAIYWHHADHQGSVFATSNAAGAPVQIVNYSPNGEVGTRIDGTQHTAPPFGSPFGYTGRHYDESTGLYHYRARYYHPALGQFMSTDPIGSRDDPNLYLYVAADPVNNTDPTGMLCVIPGNSFCQRKERYQSLARDPALNSRTVFASAAATTLDALDTPWAMSGRVGSFMEGVSARLERANNRVFAEIRAGRDVPGITDAPDGIDRAMVRFEQGIVQNSLDTLSASDPALYRDVVSSVDATFRDWGGASGAINMARSRLGHSPSIASRSDRERIGYETVRQEAAWSCVQGRSCNAQTLNGN